MKKMILGADHAGFRLKDQLLDYLKKQHFEVEDVGCFSDDSVDYPAISTRLAEAFQKAQSVDPTASVSGLLCCGSGIGIAMAANRFPWIRAVEAHDHNTAILSRKHNDANVLCFGGRVIAPELAYELFNTWISTPFEGERHQKRVDMMTHISVKSQAAPVQGSPEEIPAC